MTLQYNQDNTAAESLHTLFEAYDQWYLDAFPEEAMSRGDYSNAHRITDYSLQAIEERHRQRQKFLDTLHDIDLQSLTEQDRISYRLFQQLLQRDIDGHRFREHLMPIGGWFGPEQRIPQMHIRSRFNSVTDYENYLSRLEQVPQWIDHLIEAMELGMEQDLVPPRPVVAIAATQIEAAINAGGLEELGSPFEEMPDTFEPDEINTLRDRFHEQTFPAVVRAMERLHGFVDQQYLPAARESIAAHDLPNGEEYYEYQLRLMTTLDLTADEIFDIGMDEVTRIRREMIEVIGDSDFFEHVPEAKTLSDDALLQRFFEYLRTDSRFYYERPDDLLNGYKVICKTIDGKLPQFFQTLPRLPYGVREIPSFMAPNKSTAYYSSGDLRNGQAGYFYANTYQLNQRPKYEMIALSLHEAVPGHHLQIALARELEDLPEFRKDAWFTAYGEGWALYCERLGLEMELYDDPYDNFGRLIYEMWRACRLVVDPGIHAKGWSRDQAIQFMLDNTALSRLNIENEVDRYIGWPGQSTAYKIGELKMRELRQQAEAALGETFDVRAFHDVILLNGPLPLSMLEHDVEQWIAEQQEQSHPTALSPE